MRPLNILFAVVAILLVAGPLFLPDFVVRILILTLFFALLAEGWNLVAGYANLVSLGQGVFLGVGAYTSTQLYLTMKISPFLGMLVAIPISIAISVGFGLLTIRLKGLYFAIGSLGLTSMALIIAENANFTGGALGLLIPRKEAPLDFLFVSAIPYYYIILAFVGATVFGMRFLFRTKWGYHLRALGSNEAAAQAMGVNTTRIRIEVFALSAIITTVAGTFYAQYYSFIDPNSVFSFDITITMILIAAIGGMATVAGPLLGAFLLEPLNQFVLSFFGASLGSLDVAIFSGCLILLILRFPGGLVSLAGYLSKGKGSPAASPPPPEPPPFHESRQD